VGPPEIDATHPDLETSRYLMVTRDSGEWRGTGTEGTWYNTGEFGWGWTNLGGIYIDNVTDVQYADQDDHNLEKLRLNWTRSVGIHDDDDPTTQPAGDERAAADGRPPSGPADWWDRTGRYYAPPGVEIVLHGEARCPYIEIIRHDDPDGDGVYWRDPDGQLTDPWTYTPLPGMCAPQGTEWSAGIASRVMRVPFPPNGVIYAEGNVRIRGIMPPVRDNEGRVGVEIPPEKAPEAYFGEWRGGGNTGRTRRFDLQIVSGGTIYIEGDLLTPRGAGLIPDTAQVDIRYGSRLALLARDYVCVNTTALNPRPGNVFSRIQDPDNPGDYIYYNDAQPTYSTSGNWGYARFRGPHDEATNSDTEAQSRWSDSAAIPVYPTEPPPASLRYHSVRLQTSTLADVIVDLRLLLGHSGLYVEGSQPEGAAGGIGPPSGEPPPGLTPSPGPPDPDEPAVDVSIYINDDTFTIPWPWELEGSAYAFRRAAVADPTNFDQSDHWYVDSSPAGIDATDNWTEFLPNGIQSMIVHDSSGGPATDWLTGNDVISFASQIYPVRRYELQDSTWVVAGWQIPPRDLAYTLGPVAIAPPNRTATGQPFDDPLPVQIQALIYAQNGSWFVIPGPWFNDDPDEASAGGDPPTSGYPGYHEPLNIQISVFGAISENMPADLGSAAEWTSKWGGPYGAGGQGFLSYEFDPLLRLPRRETADRVGYLRFPRFPLTSDLVVWGERITGPAGD
jgi:hypothetical protein